MASDNKPPSKKIKRKTVRKPAAPYALKDENGKKKDGGTSDSAASERKKTASDADDSDKGDSSDKGTETGDKSAASADGQADAAPSAAVDSGSNAPTDAAPAADEAPDYAELLKPRDISPKDPNAAAPAPGRAPKGDSRSFRRTVDDKEEFCLIYRSDSFLVTRRGPVGKEGSWDIVQYPSLGAAAHAYAVRCSELSAEGFRDFR